MLLSEDQLQIVSRTSCVSVNVSLVKFCVQRYSRLYSKLLFWLFPSDWRNDMRIVCSLDWVNAAEDTWNFDGVSCVGNMSRQVHVRHWCYWHTGHHWSNWRKSDYPFFCNLLLTVKFTAVLEHTIHQLRIHLWPCRSLLCCLLFLVNFHR